MRDTEKQRVLKEAFEIVANTGNPIMGSLTQEDIEKMALNGDYVRFLYNHSFAQSLFGVAQRTVDHKFGTAVEPEYIYRLKKMVVYPEPLEYVVKFLKERREASWY